MIPPGLTIIKGELARRVIDSGAATQRRLALAVAKFAVRRTNVSDARLQRALEEVEVGHFGETTAARDVAELINELDLLAWKRQERVDEGALPYSEYTEAFNNARAANAVWAALDEDALSAVSTAIYESVHASDDVAGVEQVLSVGLAMAG